jgi:hypothetical protein
LLGNSYIYGTKLLAAELENKETLELETQDNAMFAKLILLKCITFTTPCVRTVVILIMQNVFKLQM